MTKATRVHSTPPTNATIDTTRRHLLTVAGGAVAASITSAAAEGINPSANTINALAPKTPSKEITPSRGIEGDPIYAAIEAHREANAAADAVFAESARLHRLANETVGPHAIEIPNMLEPGTTVMAMCVTDINEATIASPI